MKCIKCGRELRPGDGSKIVNSHVQHQIDPKDKRVETVYKTGRVCSECLNSTKSDS